MRHHEFIILPANIVSKHFDIIFWEMQGMKWGNRALLFRRVANANGTPVRVLCIGFRQSEDYPHVEKDGRRSGNVAVRVSLPNAKERGEISLRFEELYGLKTEFFNPADVHR